MSDVPERQYRVIVILFDSVIYEKVKDYDLSDRWSVRLCGGFYALTAELLLADVAVIVVASDIKLPDGVIEAVSGKKIALVNFSDGFDGDCLKADIARLDSEDAKAAKYASDTEPTPKKDDKALLEKDLGNLPPEDAGTAALDDCSAGSPASRPVRRNMPRAGLFKDAPRPGELLSRQEIQALLGDIDHK